MGKIPLSIVNAIKSNRQAGVSFAIQTTRPIVAVIDTIYLRMESGMLNKKVVLDNVEQTAKLFQNIAIIFGIFISAATLVYTQYEKRVDRAIDYKKDFDNNYRKTYSELMSRWNDSNDNDGAKSILSSDGDSRRAAVLKFFSNTSNRNDLDYVLDFFDNTWVCIRNNSCDHNASIELFKETATELCEVSRFYIFEQRKLNNNKKIGRGIQSIALLQRESSFAKFFPELFANDYN